MSARACKLRARLARASFTVDGRLSEDLRESCRLWQASEEAADTIHGILAHLEAVAQLDMPENVRGELEELSRYIVGRLP